MCAEMPVRQTLPVPTADLCASASAVTILTVYAHGIVVKEETFDKDAHDAHVARVVHFSGGVPISGEFDADGDGVLDAARTCDARGEIVASKPLAAEKGG